MHIPKQNGFSLVEMLVAVTILVLGIAGPMKIAANGLHSSFYSRDRIIATYLAQEAIEYIRYARDVAGLTDISGTPTNWDAFIDSSCANNKCSVDPWQVDPSGSAIKNCTSGGNTCYLSLDENTGHYVVSSSGKFQREVYAKKTGDEIVITAIITWEDQGTKTLTLTDRIHNWQIAD